MATNDRKSVKKKIFFNCTPATVFGGGQKYLFILLDALVAENFECIFTFPDFKYASEFKAEIEKRGGTSFILDIKYGRKYINFQVLLLLFKIRPNLVHINGYNEKTYHTILINKIFFNCKTILTNHLEVISKNDEQFIRNTREKKILLNYIRWPLREYFRIKFLLNRLDALIFVNSYYAQKYQVLFNFKKGKVFSIVNGIDTSFFSPDELDRKLKVKKNEFGMEVDDFVLAGIGNLVPQKRFDVFISIIKTIKTEGFKIKAIIVGQGPLMDTYQKRINDLGLQNIIYLTGFRKDVKTILNIADCFLMTSDDEGFPYALLEARSCGLPSISTDVGGIPEIINHGVDGYLFEKGDVEKSTEYVKILITNKILKNNMGKAARNDTIKRFSIQMMQKSTIDVFKKNMK